MWARFEMWPRAETKFHWYAYEGNKYRKTCSPRFCVTNIGGGWTTRERPRCADRCKRCVAVLERREKDEDAAR